MHQKTVLFCGPIDSPLNSGRYMIAGMKQIGYEVIGYDYRTKKNYETELVKIVLDKRPDYVFILKGEKLSVDLIKEFKNLKCKTILWFTMVPIEDWMIPFAKVQDFVITNVEDHLYYFHQQGIKNINWIHQGFSPEFFEIDTLKTRKSDKYYADVAMIGSMGNPIYNKRCELILLLKQNGIDIKWWGSHLSRDLKNLKYYLRGVNRLWAGSEVYMKDFADVIRHTKIFIGEDSDIPIQGKYLSNRSFAVVGCGGFYLCRRTRGIEYLFDIGVECDVYDTNDEMLEKVHYYLDNENERKRIAARGQEKILNNYTYKKQMKKIFDWVNKVS